MPVKRKQQPPLVQLLDLFLIELTNWRWSWRTLVLTSALAPLLSMVTLGVFAQSSGQETLGYIFTGNIIMALSLGLMEKVQVHFMYMRERGVLDYFATLPIYRTILLLAVVLAFLILILPTLVITIVLGSLVIHMPLHPNLLILLVIPLCAIPLTGLGALIGTFARTPEDAGAFSLLVTVALLSIGPVIVPPQRLPNILILLGHLSPATYAASALRQVLLGPITSQLALDLTVLFLLSLIVFWIVGTRMDWRQR